MATWRRAGPELSPRIRALVDAVVVAGAALLVPAGVGLGVDAVHQLLRLL